METPVAETGHGSDGRRSRDRRGGDRRRGDRRPKPPWWRSPAAYVGYGIAGALVVLLVVRIGGNGGESASPEVTAPAVAVVTEPGPNPVGVSGDEREAYTVAQYEGLLAEGPSAVGQLVRTELFCGSINTVSLRESEQMNPALAELARGEGQVVAAECRWGSEGRSSEFLLVVPPHLAEDFALAPEVEINFVSRRRVSAQVEWLGRSDELSLRNAGILRQIGR